MKETDSETWRELVPDPDALMKEIDLIASGCAAARSTVEKEARRRWEHSDDLVSTFRGFEDGRRIDGEEDPPFRRGTIAHKHWWLRAPAYAPVKRHLLRAAPGAERAMPFLLPHLIRCATALWHEGRVFTELRGPSTLRLPWMTLLPHDATLDGAAAAHARRPFNVFGRRSRVHGVGGWQAVFPERAEVLFIRHAEFDGDPADFFQAWQEEGTYPYVWVPSEALSEAAEGDAAALIEAVRSEDERYRSAARRLEKKMVVDRRCEHCNSVLEAHCESVPPKPMIAPAPGLVLDEATRDAVRSAFVPF